jgi:GrpB-like predicted nucleotidyltransferase (UPF0157 family)
MHQPEEAPIGGASSYMLSVVFRKESLIMGNVHFQNQSSFTVRAEALFEEQKQRILAVLPDADVQHIGSTAVPGSLTKGDLDLQVRVSAERFQPAVSSLLALYELNDGSDQTDCFRSFKDDALLLPVGVQLTVIGSEYDFFWRQRDYFIANPSMRAEYDAFKRQYEGGDMEEYIAAKHLFFERIMKDPKWLEG